MMPHNLDLIFTLTGAPRGGACVWPPHASHQTFSNNRVMVAGIFLGRHIAGYVANYDIASELAEIGIILLMFGVGLQFKTLLHARPCGHHRRAGRGTLL